MIGKTLAERLQLNVGDSITLSKNAVEKHRFHIKAIIEAGDATDNMLIVNLEFAQHWLEKKGKPLMLYSMSKMIKDKWNNLPPHCNKHIPI